VEEKAFSDVHSVFRERIRQVSDNRIHDRLQSISGRQCSSDRLWYASAEHHVYYVQSKTKGAPRVELGSTLQCIFPIKLRMALQKRGYIADLLKTLPPIF
jgi:hypothetical protein